MNLTIGDSGNEVTQVQLLMRALGYQVPTNGVYSAELAAAVTDWQTRLNIPPTGSWDPNTHATSLNRLAQPGGVGGPLMIPPRPSAGMDFQQWGITRDMDRFAGPSGDLPDSATVDGFEFLRNTLEHFGLGSMSEWALDLLVKGTSEEEILILMEDQPQFKARFPYNELMLQNNPMAKAEAPEHWLQWEAQVTEVMRMAGFPPGFYDGPEDFQALAAAGKSPVEIQEQINEGYKRVANAHPSVRAAFQEYFGIQGDVALALLFIDPEKSTETLTRMASEAQVAAAGRRMNFSVSRPLVEELVRVGMNEDQAPDLFSQLDKVRGLFSENVGEKEDLDVEGAIRSQAGLSGGNQRQLERRLTSRRNRGGGAGGGADLEQGLQLGRANE